jgi:hypothetical protein
MEESRCNEAAKITLPWGGKLLNYCPCHANQMVRLANAMGNTIQAQRLPNTASIQCESVNNPLTDEEKELNKSFK